MFPGRIRGSRECSRASLFMSEVGMSALLLVLLSGDIAVNPGPQFDANLPMTDIFEL